jgi:radical SAM superfamily enzyme YgiQ (UPF0313 family)
MDIAGFANAAYYIWTRIFKGISTGGKRMRIYLLNPPFFPHFFRSARWQDTGRGGTLYYPIWISYAAGLLELSHEVKLVDAPAWNWDRNTVVEDIGRYNPDLIVVDSSFTSLKNDLEVAREIKDVCGKTIVLVGPPTSKFSETILKESAVDITARLEYEYTLLELAETIENKEDIKTVKGISFKDDGKIIHNPDRGWTTSADLDALPFVSKVYQKHLKIKDYFLSSSLYPEVQVFTGRGCPFHCTFCAWPETLMGRKYRARSIENVINELEWIEANLPEVKEVFFEDDTFTINKQRVIEFCEAYRQRGFKIAWACNARATLDFETMKIMRKSGCRLVIVGYESGDDKILEEIRKGVTVSHIRQFARDAKKAGLLVHGDFVIGLPGETKETIMRTVSLIKDIKPELLQVSVASPFPGTEFYRWAKENGYLLTDDPNEYLDEQGHQKSIISYPLLSSKDITYFVDKILKKYYITPKYLPLALSQIFRKNGIKEFKRIYSSSKAFLGYSNR